MTVAQFKLVNDVCTVLTAVAFLLCIYRFPVRNREVKLIALNLFVSLAVTGIIVIGHISGPPINLPQNINCILMFPIILLMYHLAWNGRYRYVTIVCTVAFAIFSSWNIFFGQRTEFNSYTLAFGGLLVILHSVLYFYHLLVELPVQKLSRLPMFWFNAAYLTYFASSLFIFAAYMVEAFYDFLLVYWTIQNLLRIVQFILIIAGLWQDLRNIRSQSSLPLAR